MISTLTDRIIDRAGRGAEGDSGNDKDQLSQVNPETFQFTFDVPFKEKSFTESDTSSGDDVFGSFSSLNRYDTYFSLPVLLKISSATHLADKKKIHLTLRP